MFKNLKMYVKMLILIGVASLALIINCIVGYSGFSGALRGVDQIYAGSVENLKYLSEMKNLINNQFIGSVQKLRDQTITWNEAQNEIRDINSKLDSLWVEYLNALQTQNETFSYDQTVNKQLHQSIKNFEPVILKVQELLGNHNIDELNAFGSKDLFIYGDAINKDIDRAVLWIVSDTQKDYKEVSDTVYADKITLIIVFFLALIIFIIISGLITLSITKPLHHTVDIVNKMAEGDITVVIDDPSRDEVGQLQQAMKVMMSSNKKMIEAVAKFSTGDLDVIVTPRSDKDLLAKALNAMVDSSRKMSEVLSDIARGDLSVNIQKRSDKDTLGIAFATMTEKLRGIVGNIQTEVTELTSSAQEIVASVSQVSSGTAETAAAVTETTTTVEELKQTAQLSANKAKDVLANAEETMLVVKNSEKLLARNTKRYG